MHDTRLIEAYHINGIGYARLVTRSGLCIPDRNIKTVKAGQTLFQLGQRVPVPGNHHQHCHLCANRAHAAFNDIAAAIEHDAGQFLDDAWGFIACSRYNDQLFHSLLRQTGSVCIQSRSVPGIESGAIVVALLPWNGCKSTIARCSDRIPGMFKGSMVALVTPMTGGGAIDFAALSRLLDFHLDAGTDALVIGGTTGESATLNANELVELLTRTKTHVAGRIPVIAGSGSNSTASTIAQTQCARDAGADAALIVTPYYNKPTQHGLIAHFTAVSDAVDIPVILYNVPGRTACDMQSDTVATLAGHPRIIGIKEATGDIARTKDIIARCGDRIEVYSGDDATARELFTAGAVGVISVTANIAPAEMHGMCQAALDSDTAEAASIDARLEGLHRDLFIESNPIPVKWGLHRMGLIDDGIRLPLTPLAEAYQSVVEKAMMAAGIVLD